MNTTKRNYSYRDVEMLIVALTIIENAMMHLAFLGAQRPSWTIDFFSNLKASIEAAMNTYLGIDSAKSLRQTSKALYEIQVSVLDSLKTFKIQLSEDFKDDKAYRDELLKLLGFDGNYAKVQRKSQEALIQLLFTFTTNLTPELRDQLIVKGMLPQTIDNIVSQAENMKAMEVKQEMVKNGRKAITVEAVTELNKLYDQVLSISRISSDLFKKEPQIKEQFSFNKLAKKLTIHPNKK